MIQQPETLVFALLIWFAIGQKAPQPSLQERWSIAKAAFNQHEAARLETALKDLSKKSRQTKGVERQKIIAQIADYKKRLTKAKAESLPPMIQIGAYATGLMGYLVEDCTVDRPRLARARIILFMDAIPILNQKGFKAQIDGKTVIVEAKTDAQSMDTIKLDKPVEVIGKYKDIGGEYWVLRAFDPQNDPAIGRGQVSTKSGNQIKPKP